MPGEILFIQNSVQTTSRPPAMRLRIRSATYAHTIARNIAIRCCVQGSCHCIRSFWLKRLPVKVRPQVYIYVSIIWAQMFLVLVFGRIPNGQHVGSGSAQPRLFAKFYLWSSGCRRTEGNGIGRRYSWAQGDRADAAIPFVPVDGTKSGTLSYRVRVTNLAY